MRRTPAPREVIAPPSSGSTDARSYHVEVGCPHRQQCAWISDPFLHKIRFRCRNSRKRFDTGHKKMAAAAASSIANSGMLFRNRIVQTIQTLGFCRGCVFVYTFYTHNGENQYNVLLKILPDSTKLPKIQENETVSVPLRHARQKKKFDKFIGFLRLFTVNAHILFVLL